MSENGVCGVERRRRRTSLPELALGDGRVLRPDVVGLVVNVTLGRVDALASASTRISSPP